MEIKKKINLAFNLALFVFMLFTCTLNVLFATEAERVLWDDVFDYSPELAVFGASVLAFFAFWGGTHIVKVFWNRFLSDVFALREITFQESLSIVLILTILSI